MANIEILRAVDESNAGLALPSTQVILPPNFGYFAHPGPSSIISDSSNFDDRTVAIIPEGDAN